MNVLYLTINPNRASTTVPTEGWFRLLPEKGLQPVLVSRQLGSFHEWTSQQDYPSYQNPLPFPSRSRPWPFLYSLARLRGIVKKHKIQLIHCNEQDTYPIAGYLARLCRIPVVVSVHFTMERAFCQWAFAAQRCPDRLFFTSQGNLEACRQGVTGIVPEHRWRLLLNGIDLEQYRVDSHRRERFRSYHRIPHGRPVVGVACALRPRKQLEHLIDIVLRLHSVRPLVAIAGGPVSGDESYASRLIESAQASLRDQLLYLGHLDDLRDFYNGLDLFINTSQEEACSLSVLQALSCGLPVVGYPSKSVDTQILPLGGEIVEQDRVDLLTEAATGWLQDAGRLGQARSRARQQAEDHFDIRVSSNQLLDEYQQLLAERKTDAPDRLTR